MIAKIGEVGSGALLSPFKEDGVPLHRQCHGLIMVWRIFRYSELH